MNKFYLVFFTLSIFCLTNSVMSYWEFAVSTDNKINFYDAKWNHLTTVSHFNKPASIAFDETREIIYFTDQNHKTASIFSLKIPLDEIKIGNPVIKSYEIAVKRLHGNESVKAIAYDPLDEMLYWTDIKNRKIYKISVKNNNAGNIEDKLQPKIVIDFSNSDFYPDGIAIDFCNRLLYWTSYNHSVGIIERSSLDGTNREIFEDKNLYYPHGIFIDYFDHRVYWVVNQKGSEFTVESSNGTNRKVHIKSDYNKPVDLTVTKNNIYWTDTENNIIWNISKYSLPNDFHNEPNKILELEKLSPTGIVSRNEYLTNLKDNAQCKDVIKQINYRLTKTTFGKSEITTPKNYNLGRLNEILCLNDGEYNRDADKCICKFGYNGRRCEINECHNYCNDNGKCKISPIIGPNCICHKGFTGARCELNKCNKYCVNNGTCMINTETYKPNCLCPNGFSGEYCEVDKCHQYCLNNGKCNILNDQPICHCIKDFNGKHCENNLTEICPLLCQLQNYGQVSELPFGCNKYCEDIEIEITTIYKEPITNRPITICNRTYNTTIIFVVLGVVIALLLAFLIIVTLRKIYKPARPRIKKTFLVHKKLSQTPLTSRPVATEQCEIIIENCCNMNICDTPCFDPKMLQQSYDGCGTDDKKQLINTSDDLTF